MNSCVSSFLNSVVQADDPTRKVPTDFNSGIEYDCVTVSKNIGNDKAKVSNRNDV